jgi:hypothetical protein
MIILNQIFYFGGRTTFYNVTSQVYMNGIVGLSLKDLSLLTKITPSVILWVEDGGGQ